MNWVKIATCYLSLWWLFVVTIMVILCYYVHMYICMYIYIYSQHFLFQQSSIHFLRGEKKIGFQLCKALDAFLMSTICETNLGRWIKPFLVPGFLQEFAGHCPQDNPRGLRILARTVPDQERRTTLDSYAGYIMLYLELDRWKYLCKHESTAKLGMPQRVSRKLSRKPMYLA